MNTRETIESRRSVKHFDADHVMPATDLAGLVRLTNLAPSSFDLGPPRSPSAPPYQQPQSRPVSPKETKRTKPLPPRCSVLQPAFSASPKGRGGLLARPHLPLGIQPSAAHQPARFHLRKRREQSHSLPVAPCFSRRSVPPRKVGVGF